MNNIKAKSKKVIERMKLHSKLRNKSNPKKVSTPMTHVRTKISKKEKLKAKKALALQRRLKRGQAILQTLKDFASDVQVKLSKERS